MRHAASTTLCPRKTHLQQAIPEAKSPTCLPCWLRLRIAPSSRGAGVHQAQLRKIAIDAAIRLSKLLIAPAIFVATR
jgi:hypothetical protein